MFAIAYMEIGPRQSCILPRVSKKHRLDALVLTAHNAAQVLSTSSERLRDIERLLPRSVGESHRIILRDVADRLEDVERALRSEADKPKPEREYLRALATAGTAAVLSLSAAADAIQVVDHFNGDSAAQSAVAQSVVNVHQEVTVSCARLIEFAPAPSLTVLRSEDVTYLIETPTYVSVETAIGDYSVTFELGPGDGTVLVSGTPEYHPQRSGLPSPPNAHEVRVAYDRGRRGAHGTPYELAPQNGSALLRQGDRVYLLVQPGEELTLVGVVGTSPDEDELASE